MPARVLIFVLLLVAVLPARADTRRHYTHTAAYCSHHHHGHYVGGEGHSRRGSHYVNCSTGNGYRKRVK